VWTGADFGFHANELKLLLSSSVDKTPGEQASHSCLDLDGSLLLGQHLHLVNCFIAIMHMIQLRQHQAENA
jgi:hypothetical protein